MSLLITNITSDSGSLTKEYQRVLDSNDLSNGSYGKPNTSQKTAQDNFIKIILSVGKFDIVKVFGTNGSSNFTDFNWINPALYKSTKINAPTFVRNGGIFGNAVDSYIDVGWKPSDGVNYTQNNCEQIIYYKNLPNAFNINTPDGVRTAGSGGGQNGSLLNPLYASTTVLANSNSNVASAPSNAQFDIADGLYFWGRTGSTNEFVKKGSGTRVVYANTSTGRAAFNQVLGALSTAGSLGGFQNRNILLYTSGAALSIAEEATFKTAWDTYIAIVNAESQLPIIGTIYNKSTWSNLADFSNSGVTVNIVGNKLVFSGGTGTFTKSLNITQPTKLGKWSQTIRFTVGNKNATSYGVGVGIRSSNSAQALSMISWFTMNTGGGAVNLYAGASMSFVAASSSIVFNAGDVIEMTCITDGWTVTSSAYNVTTSGATVSVTNTTSGALANTGRFCIFSVGGTFTVNTYTITSNEYYQPSVLFIGDSKTQGGNTTRFGFTFPSLFQNAYGPVAIHAGGSDRIVDVLTTVTEINTMIKPATVVLCIGRNDKAGGASDGTIQANYASLVSQLISGGSRVVHITGLYETSAVDQAPQRTFINSTYSSSNVIDILNNVLTLSDTVHPDTVGHTTVANLIIAAKKI